MEAQKTALLWSTEICYLLKLEKTNNWKFFKRNLISAIFGKPEHKRFYPPTNINEVMNYVNSFKDVPLRISVFPNNIACGAKSYFMLGVDENGWSELIESIRDTDAFEIFPDSSFNSTLCFRRFSNIFNQDLIYEAGNSNAEDFFEKHPNNYIRLIAELKNKSFTYKIVNDKLESGITLLQELKDLINNFELFLNIKIKYLMNRTGIESCSIEGYYYKPLNKIKIVDLDLPFDLVFMLKK